MYLCRLKCPKEHHKVMKKEKRDNYTFLTHAPVHHVIFTMAIPTIISMLSTSMYNLADTYFVGSINTQSVAAVGVSFAAMAVIQAIGFSSVTEQAIMFRDSWAPSIRKRHRRWQPRALC